jgi:hypothetical protein
MKKLKSLIILCILFSLPFLAFTQPDPRVNGNGSSVGNNPVGPGGPVGSPIDGGLSILLMLGAGYGIKKFKDSRKEV